MSEKQFIGETQRTRLIELDSQIKQLSAYYGHIHYQKRLLEKELLSIDLELDRLDAEVLEITKIINTEFGKNDGIDLETGEVLPEKETS